MSNDVTIRLKFNNGYFRVPTSVNLTASPGAPNVHHNSGGRRMARINNNSVIICPHGSGGERTYRSTNDGTSWTEIDTDGTYSGCLITSMNNCIYHFYINRDNGTIHMVKFVYDATPAAPVTIYTSAAAADSSIITEYQMLNATTDSAGNLYVATHFGASTDHIYMFKSTDSGSTWTNPIQVSDTLARFHYCHLEVDASDAVYCVFRNEANDDLRFTRSDDGGFTWITNTSLGTVGNPAILTVGSGTLYVFGQGENIVGASDGVFVKKSTNSGSTWGSWIQVEATSGYGDPSPALGYDGKIFVALRSNNGTGITSGSFGDQSRQKLKMSSDGGVTWSTVDQYYEAERVGTRSHIRYQTWWNYGGPLEWCWMQYVNNGVSIPIYYDINNQESIYNQT